MKIHDPRHNGAQPSRESDLGRLIEAEDRLAQVLAGARRQAGELVDAARTAAAEVEAAASRELAAAHEQVAAAIEAESSRLVAQVLADGERAAAAFDALSDQRVRELAQFVVDRLLDAEPGAGR